jgi:dienelactone hydrolase
MCPPMKRCAQLVLFAMLLAIILTFANGAVAQQRASAPREDGQTTPLLVYGAAGSVSGCAPLALISHGAGGSEDGYRYLAEAMSQQGFTAVVMGHRESGLEAMRKEMRALGIMRGVTALVASPTAEGARLKDLTAALKWAETQCHPPYKVLLGHSMGAETVLLEAGARNMIGLSAPPTGQSQTGQDRFDAYVALSPEGPGIIFPDDAWSGIRKPVLIMTGTRDQSLKGGPEARLIPWNDLPGTPAHCQWVGVIDGAMHGNFAGDGIGAKKVEEDVTRTIATWLDGVRKQACVLPAATKGLNLRSK